MLPLSRRQKMSNTTTTTTTNAGSSSSSSSRSIIILQLQVIRLRFDPVTLNYEFSLPNKAIDNVLPENPSVYSFMTAARQFH